MKVICTDNFDRDSVSQRLIKENLTQEEAKALCKELNNKGGDISPDYYITVPDDYVLYEFEP